MKKIWWLVICLAWAGCEQKESGDEGAVTTPKDMALADASGSGDLRQGARDMPGMPEDMFRVSDARQQVDETDAMDKSMARDMAQSMDLSMARDLEGCEPKIPGANPLSSLCSCACREQDVVFDNQGKTPITFEYAVYGLTRPSAAGEPWGIHLEAYDSDTATGCPVDGAATPDHTVILSGLEWPGLRDGQGKTALKGTMLDFTGDIVPDGASPLILASMVRVMPVAASVCTACTQRGEEDGGGFLSLDVRLVFPQGEMKGQVVARHCKSLDA